jgi:hypothetical protein
MQQQIERSGMIMQAVKRLGMKKSELIYLLQAIMHETQRVFQELFTVIESLPDDVHMEKIEPRSYLV